MLRRISPSSVEAREDEEEDDGPPILVDSDSDDDGETHTKSEALFDQGGEASEEEDEWKGDFLSSLMDAAMMRVAPLPVPDSSKPHDGTNRHRRPRPCRKRRTHVSYRNCCADVGCEGRNNDDDSESDQVKQKVLGLRTILPEGIKPIAEDEWVQIDVKVDSGATETVMPEEMLQGVIDRQGVKYKAANGQSVPNLGQRQFLGITDDGGQSKVTAQVCGVNQMLMSVSKIARQGNRIVFDDDRSYIEHKASGERTWMSQDGGMYSLKMWVSRQSTKDAGF